MYDPSIGRWLSRDPIGFAAGDSNLYRYVSNDPEDSVDPSGEVGGTIHHPYPLHLGGAANQPLIQLDSVADHQAFHNYLADRGYTFGNAGRAAWARLTTAQQRALIVRALRAANVPISVIRANIGAIMRNATPGVLTPRPLPSAAGRIIVPVIVVAAIVEILANPSSCSAAEVDPTWQGRPESDTRLGHVELGESFVIIERPRAWNLFGANQRVVASWQGREWTDAGDMTASEARGLGSLGIGRRGHHHSRYRKPAHWLLLGDTQV